MNTTPKTEVEKKTRINERERERQRHTHKKIGRKNATRIEFFLSLLRFFFVHSFSLVSSPTVSQFQRLLVESE